MSGLICFPSNSHQQTLKKLSGSHGARHYPALEGLRQKECVFKAEASLNHRGSSRESKDSKDFSSWCTGPSYNKCGQNQSLFNVGSLNTDEEENQRLIRDNFIT